MKVLQNRELTPAKKLIAYTMLMPNLPNSPLHELAWQSNLELGQKIKQLIQNDTLIITGIDTNSILTIRVPSESGSFGDSFV